MSSVWPEYITLEIDETATQTEEEWPSNLTIEIEGGTPGIKGEQGDPGIVVGTTPPVDTSLIWVDTS